MKITLFQTQKMKRSVAFAFSVGLLTLGGQSFAQTSNQSAAASHATPASAQATAEVQAPVALEGNCPVCIVAKKEWVMGVADYQTVFDGKAYYFPNAEVKAMFDEAPEKWVPALNGDCILCYAKMGKRVPGDIRFGTLYEGRVFLFPSEKEKAAFDASAAQFANADVAANGNCIVCQVKMNKAVSGSTDFTAIVDGLRYLFPSDAERQMFLADPAAFVTPTAGTPTSQPTAEATNQTGLQMGAQTSAAMQTVSIQGKAACAGCSYGVKPIGAPNELGMAVVDSTGNVYVVEDCHLKWPEIYAARFDGGAVSVTGTVLKTEGKVTWLTPSKLSAM